MKPSGPRLTKVDKNWSISCHKCSENGQKMVQNGPKIVQNLLEINPKMVQNWSQNGTASGWGFLWHAFHALDDPPY